MKKDRMMASRVCSLLGSETSDNRNQERKLKMNTNIKSNLIRAGLRGIAVTVAALFAAAASAGNWQDNRETAWPNNGNLNGNVYTINNARELAQFAYTIYSQSTTYAGKTVILADDINLSAHNWQPAGTAFKGVFDGNGKTITGLTISATPSATYDGGLFGRLNTDAVVRNINLEGLDIQVKANSGAAIYIGGITGGFTTAISLPDAAIVENCRVDGTIVVSNSSNGGVYVGGIVGFMNLSAGKNGRTLRDCVNNADISAGASSGGVVYLGGIAGHIMLPAKAYNLLNTGTIQRTGTSTGNAYVGGLVGALTVSGGADLYLANGFNTGNVTTTSSGTRRVGGLVGSATDSVIATSVANLYWLTGTAATAFGNNPANLPASIIPVGAALPARLDAAHPFYRTDSLLAALNGWVGARNTWGSILHSWGVEPGVNGGFPVLLESVTPTSWADAANRETAWPNNGNVNGTTRVVNNAAELAQFAWTVEQGTTYVGQTVILAQDIDLSAHNWMPAGTTFGGTFDGNGKTVRGMRVVMDGVTDNAGFFGTLVLNGTVKNLKLADAEVAVMQTSGDTVFVGGITGRMGVNSLIDGAYVSGRVYGKNLAADGELRIGGIAGENARLTSAGTNLAGTIRNSANAASVTGDSSIVYIGGIAGYLGHDAKGRILNSLNMGPIHGAAGSGIFAGGIVGYMYGTGSTANETYISNNLNTGSITRSGGAIPNIHIGSVVGYCFNEITGKPYITNSYWLEGTAAAPISSAFVIHKTVIMVNAPAPGTLLSTHLVYEANTPLAALNAGAKDDAAFLGWVIKPNVNDGYPVLDTAYPSALLEITLDHNNGSGDTQIVLAANGAPLPPANVPTRLGHTFKGFFDALDVMYYGPDAIGARDWDKDTGDKLHAKWAAITNILVQFDYNGATGGNGDLFRFVTFGQPYGKLPAPIKAGHTFGGWKLSGLPDEVTADTLVSIAAPHELIAQWIPTVPIFVLFEYNGATGGNDEAFRFVTFHAPYGTLPAPTKTGHTFDGWFHAYTSDKVEANTLVANTEPHALEARWTAKAITVTFDYDGATDGNDEETRIVTFNEAYGALPDPAKPGHSFAGWHIEGHRAEIFDDTLVAIENDHTLVAAWTARPIEEQSLHVRAINVDRATGNVVLRWDPAQIEGELVSYEIHATGDLTTAAADWDIYEHDGAAVEIDDSGAAEHKAILKPALLANPLGNKGFFKVKALTQH